ncbi:MAG TPA: PD-(D/E)XK nuclease family protein [Gallicola sp.]|nr:PD-(D/E)XK nuclease family protein [Gallicola sp.]
MIEFLKEDHLYLVDGVITPSVTQILQFLFPDKYKDVPPEILAKKAEYGSILHKVIEIAEQEQMFEIEALRQKIKGINYLIELSFKQYLKIKEKYNIDVLEQEQIVAYKDYYCGTFDMIAKVDGKKSLIDIKTTAELDIEYLSWQLSFYELAKGEQFEKLYVIWLPKKSLGELKEIPRKPKKELLRVLKEYLDCRNNE